MMEKKGILKGLENFLLISFTLIVIVPSIIYFYIVFYNHVNIPFNIAVYLMLFSGLTNMEIWLLSVWTARSTLKGVGTIDEKVKKYEKLLGMFEVVEDDQNH